MADDGYVSWYQAKLWNLVPAVYRSQDATLSGVPGPLQELLNRIGAQTATLRRGIDRLAENQSIETCDDWAIPYIGDLLATRLVSCLDARAQRLDVANTIYYRRRAGTLGLLEELVSDIAGRDARAVEFFRRLGRTRHQFDPPIGNVFLPNAPLWTAETVYAAGAIVANGVAAYVCSAGGKSGTTGPAGGGEKITDGGVTWRFYNPLGALVPAVIQGLAGVNARTPAGGFADLRNAYAAQNAGTAFDEFSHTADLRAGTESFGWYNISHLGMFIWWLHSFPIQNATPVSNAAGCFTFDPSGRQIPLFAKESRTEASFGDDWVSPNEWQLPVRISETLYAAYPDQFFGPAFAVLAGDGNPIPRSELTIHPESGLFSFIGDAPEGGLITQYCFGLMSTVGAGGFSTASLESIALPATITKLKGAAALPALTGSATVEIGDSLTYQNFSAALDIGAATVAIIAADQTRPMLRWPGAKTWTINGNGGTLILQGLWLQGADIILTGSFDSIVLRFVTLDPGTEDGIAIDNMPLLPVHLTVEASITTLTLTNCITGPIRTQNGGAIEQLTATDSIIQSINAGDYALQNTTGGISLARCTILGPAAIHKLDASECIFDDVTIAEDSQHGCIRFCAIAAGSIVHAPYLSVSIPPAGPLFFSRRFGDPNYARLLRLADAAIINAQAGDTILGGARNGSEIGAFQSEGIALKRRGLVAKFEEFAPLGVFPVWIDAD
jgi:hypothetical protein